MALSNRKSRGGVGWLIPIGCAGAVVLVGGAVVGIILFAMGAIKSSGAYKLALKQVQEDVDVIDYLGEPIEPGVLVYGKFKSTRNSGEADVSFHVSGPYEKGKVYVEAEKIRGQWIFDYIAVDIEIEDKEEGELIVIVDSSE